MRDADVHVRQGTQQHRTYSKSHDVERETKRCNNSRAMEVLCELTVSRSVHRRCAGPGTCQHLSYSSGFAHPKAILPTSFQLDQHPIGIFHTILLPSRYQRRQYSHAKRTRAHNNHNQPPPRHRHTPRIRRVIITPVPPHLPRIFLLPSNLHIPNIFLRAIVCIITPVPISRPDPAQTPQRSGPVPGMGIRSTRNLRSIC
jgi:hypothetical protein